MICNPYLEPSTGILAPTWLPGSTKFYLDAGKVTEIGACLVGPDDPSRALAREELSYGAVEHMVFVVDPTQHASSGLGTYPLLSPRDTPAEAQLLYCGAPEEKTGRAFQEMIRTQYADAHLGYAVAGIDYYLGIPKTKSRELSASIIRESLTLHYDTGVVPFEIAGFVFSERSGSTDFIIHQCHPYNLHIADISQSGKLLTEAMGSFKAYTNLQTCFEDIAVDLGTWPGAFLYARAYVREWESDPHILGANFSLKPPPPRLRPPAEDELRGVSRLLPPWKI